MFQFFQEPCEYFGLSESKVGQRDLLLVLSEDLHFVDCLISHDFAAPKFFGPFLVNLDVGIKQVNGFETNVLRFMSVFIA